MIHAKLLMFSEEAMQTSELSPELMKQTALGKKLINVIVMLGMIVSKQTHLCKKKQAKKSSKSAF